MTRAIEGLIAFSITPLQPDESLDEARLRSHLDALIDGGVDAITLFGSTGAIGSFSEAERRRVVEVALPHVAGRVPVMVGTGAISTAEAVRLSQHAQEQGASAVLVVPISYWLLGEAELLAHYKAIDRAVSIPMAIYNSPRLTGIDMLPPLIARLAELQNVRYLKESSPELLRIAQVKRLTGGKLKVFAGRDDSVLEAFQVGADAWASGCANFMPALCRRLLAQLRDPAQLEQARTLEAAIHPITEYAMSKGLVRTCHDALKAMGQPVGAPRRPILPLAEADYAQWRDLLLGAKSTLLF
jgi:4-hydroxy-tetrahydrodipicolinate synthase